MKKFKSIVLSLLAVVLFTPVFSQSYINQPSKNSKLSQEFGRPGVMTTTKFWDLGEIDGEDKFLVNFQAVEIGDNQSGDMTKGVKVTVKDDNKKTDAQEASLFYFDKLETYIDVDEYEDVMNSINYMLNTLNIWDNEKMDRGNIYHKTNDNFIFGLYQEGKKQTGVMKIRFERVQIVCEFKKPDKALEDMKEIMVTAQNELYIEANREKYEKAQKEKEELEKEAEKARKEKEKSDEDIQIDDEDQL